MKKTIWFLASFLLVSVARAIVIPVGPPAIGSGVQGNGTDGYETRWSTYYGQPEVVNSGWLYETSTGLGVNTLSPGAQIQVNGLTAGTTIQILNSAASPSADAFEYKVNGSTETVIGPQGHIIPRIYSRQQVDTLVPDYIGAIITVNNMLSTVFFPGGFALCQSTGSAVDQWAVVGGTHGVNQNGCGVLQ